MKSIIKGGGLEIGFNVTYLLDVLSRSVAKISKLLSAIPIAVAYASAGNRTVSLRCYAHATVGVAPFPLLQTDPGLSWMGLLAGWDSPGRILNSCPLNLFPLSSFVIFSRLQLLLSPQLNLFIGNNAAGKTSLLETLYVLARGRSFRARQLDKLVQNNRDGFRLVVQLKDSEGRTFPVGMQRTGRRLVCRIDGQPVKRLSELAALFPVQWLGGNLHAVIEEGPAYRRQMLDWGLFHVKPSYIDSWKRFQKLLKQRNAAIRQRSGRREVQAWDGELATAGEQLDAFRREYIRAFLPEIERLASHFPILEYAVSVNYKKGWADDATFAETLSDTLEKDRNFGFTHSGPQRADLAFSYDGKPAKERLSRGQQKVYVVALQLAQATLLYKATGKTSLFLLDDLGAELDATNQAKVMGLLRAIEAQVFVTSINDVELKDLAIGKVKRFHVKHGNVTEML